MKLIDKDKVIEEIEKQGIIQPQLSWFTDKMIQAIDSSVEVKEVDCEREIGIYTTKELLKKRYHSTSVFHLTQADINSIAKHFFELGIKAKKGERKDSPTVGTGEAGGSTPPPSTSSP